MPAVEHDDEQDSEQTPSRSGSASGESADKTGERGEEGPIRKAIGSAGGAGRNSGKMATGQEQCCHSLPQSANAGTRPKTIKHSLSLASAVSPERQITRAK